MLERVKDHLPEYAIEAWCLGTFMLSACTFGVLLFNPASPAAGLNVWLRDVLMGIAMGSTAVSIICSPWGKRSGAHFNPAVTLTFLRLGKIGGIDAIFYVASQFIGGIVGVALAWMIFGNLLSDSAVNFVATLPGRFGIVGALAAEMTISFLMMTMILYTTNSVVLSRLTPFIAGLLVATFIIFEAPVSGMSMNPARSLSSALFSGNLTGLWIYFIAPPVAMLAASELYLRTRGLEAVLCAKLHHHNRARCIFNCDFSSLARVNA